MSIHVSYILLRSFLPILALVDMLDTMLLSFLRRSASSKLGWTQPVPYRSRVIMDKNFRKYINEVETIQGSVSSCRNTFTSQVPWMASELSIFSDDTASLADTYCPRGLEYSTIKIHLNL